MNTHESKIGIIEFQIRAHQIKVSDSLANKFYATESAPNYRIRWKTYLFFSEFGFAHTKRHSFRLKINSSMQRN